MRDAFEAAILANPDDTAAHAAYSDWLTEQGDPRGEFIRVQLALEDESLPKKQRNSLKKHEAKLFAAHAEEWLGPLGPLLLTNEAVERYTPRAGREAVPNYEFHFARGFLASLRVVALNFAAARALRDSPGTRFLRGLAIQFDGSYLGDNDPPRPDDGVPRQANSFRQAYPLLRADFASLRTFRLGEEADVDGLVRNHATVHAEMGLNPHPVRCHTYCPAVPDLVTRMPRLKELHLDCKEYDIDRLFKLRSLTHLRVLRVYHFGQRGGRGFRTGYAYPLDVLARNPALANLTHLLFHPHFPEDSYFEAPRSSFLPLDQVRHVLRSKHLNRLTHLQVRLSNMGDEGCREVVASGVLKRLIVLDLRHGCVTDDGAAVLADCPDARSLELLDLSRNALTEAGVARLRAAGVNVQADTQ